MYEADGERALVRFWECFRAPERVERNPTDAASLGSLLAREVSATMGQAIQDWN
jgi:hypothetical protein